MKAHVKKLILLASMFSYITSYGQESIIEDVNYNQLEKYIELAKQNYPRRKIFAAQEKRAKEGVPLATMGYFEALNASYYYRPDSKTALDVNNPYIYNGWQFGVNINVGTLLANPFKVKQAKAEYEVAKLDVMDYDLSLVNEVKSKYYDYILSLKDLKVKTQAAQDAQSLYDDLRYKFEKAEITHESYSVARTALTDAISNKLQMEAVLMKAKDALEQIIGVSLEEAKNIK